MKSLFTLNLTPRMQGVRKTLCMAVFLFTLLCPAGYALPMGYENMQNGLSQLRVGGSGPADVMRAFGSPDEVVSSGRVPFARSSAMSRMEMKTLAIIVVPLEK